ncbi:MAG: glycoside hydrolase family 3 N-terminal domain-containing protein [Saprospiraceae bacterium]|nr:glycoside hydrolase family 3 N-terminal domain-containing protein [Saprospiraceae bacterium]
MMISFLRQGSLLSLLIFALISCQPSKQLQAQQDDDYSIQIDSVLSLMTLDEKIGQMTLYTTDWESTGPTIRKGYQDDIRKGTCGALFNSHTVAFTRLLQDIAVKESRLGIPLLFGYDVIHGYKTIFPVPLGESCSWDLAAMEQSASIAAAEAAAAGLHWTFAPMVDISREPRWGRVMEGAGEDPYLGSLIARARVHGFQGDHFNGTDKILACIKHFAGYGAPIAGRDYNTVDMSERTFRDIYFPPYKAGIEAGARTIMTSFNDLDGIPSTGNKWLLDDILRKELGFTGFVVTDYTSINEMVAHGYATDEAHAGELAANATVDMDMQGAVFQRFLKESIADGKVSEKLVDDAVRRILRIKFELGLFKDPYKFSNEQREKEVVFSTANLEAARDIARKSIVLLKNEGNVLPITKGKKIALVGPLAADRNNLIGEWRGAGDGTKSVSVLDAFQERATKDGFTFTHAMGCEITGESTSGFAEAVRNAQAADIVIVVVGESWKMSGEAKSRADISIPGVQEQLVKELVATGKPVVVVLMNGRPLAIPWIAQHATAIVEAWLPGTMGGPAVSDVLFGDYNPSAKLTMTFPRHVGQVPIFYNEKNTGRPFDPNNGYTSKYLDMPNTPQYPFGFGLSYTTFTYDSMVVSGKNFSFSDTINVSVNITNTGALTGEEIVQLYVRDLVGSVTRPVKELKGFEKIKLAPGERKSVTFKITSADLAFHTADMTFKAEPGLFWMMVGPDSERLQKKEIRLVK